MGARKSLTTIAVAFCAVAVASTAKADDWRDGWHGGGD